MGKFDCRTMLGKAAKGGGGVAGGIEDLPGGAQPKTSVDFS